MMSADDLFEKHSTEGLISHRLGILTYVKEFLPDPGDSTINIFGGETVDTVSLGGEGRISNVGGAEFNRVNSYMACIGEALERYSASFVQDLQFGTVKEIAGAVTGWPSFSEVSYQYSDAYSPLTETTEIAWTSAHNYHTGEKVMVPASLVYLPWVHSREKQTVFPSISTGLSAHLTFRKAVEGSVYELIERDAFTLAWLSGQPLPVVPIDWTREHVRARGVPDDWDVRITDLSNDTGAFTYLTSIFAPTNEGRIFAVGCSSHIDAMKALNSSIEEALHTVPYVRFLIRDDPNWDPGEKLENLHSFEDHCKLYSIRTDLHSGLVNIFPEIPVLNAPIPGSKTKFHKFDDLVRNLESLGVDLFVKRLTTRDVEQMGFEVSRVISPQLMPLHSHYQLPYLRCDRLWNLEEVFPFDITNLKNDKEVFPYPHPFA